MADVRDVVIVGGGPAGTTTALALVDAAPALASRVVVLEKARYPREKPCAGALGRRGDKLLESLGARIDVPSAPVAGMSFRGADAEAVAAPGNIGRVVRRIEFDQALAAVVRSRGVEVRDGVRVDAVEQEAGVPVLRTSEGAVKARVVVGCDGVGSVVRKALGLGVSRMRAQVVEVDTAPVRGDRDRSLLHFDASDRALPGYAWDFPTIVDGRLLVCRGVYRLKIDGDGEDGPDVSAVLAARLRRQGLDPAHCKNKRYAERGFEPTVRLAAGPRMLVGEAAGIDPVTGEGIAQAIEYGVLAGRYLAQRLGGGDAGPWTSRRLAGRSEPVTACARSRNPDSLRATCSTDRRAPRSSASSRETSDALYVGAQHFAAQPYDLPRLVEVLGHGAAQLVGLSIARLLGSR